MPPRTKAAGGLMGFTGSDSEADFDDVLLPTKAQPAKKPRGRPAGASKVTKPSHKQARGNSVRPAARAQTSPRRALADKSSNTKPKRQAISEKAQMNDDDDVMLEAQPASPEKSVRSDKAKTRTAKESKTTDSRPEETMENDTVGQAPAMEVDDEPYQPADVDEDLSDASVRRKLGDLTRKHESLEARYRELRQVGVVEAERNFERLQKQADESAAAATKLINELKAELAAQTALVKQGQETERQLERSETKCQGLQSKVSDLNGSLTEAKSEIKTLSTKLAAYRSAEATGTVPGSALKAGAAGNRAVHADVVRLQKKEDLYGDLTGLILRGVGLGEGEDVFDCIQTGRNGTLHFKLALDSQDCYEYRPQLDDNRDEELMDILPDYLVEDITFPRAQAAKFYARVMKSLTERLD